MQAACKNKAELVARGIGRRRRNNDEFHWRWDGLAAQQREEEKRAADVGLLRVWAASWLQQHLCEVDHVDSHASTRERRREGGKTAHGGDAASKLLPVLL